jgi:pimeloyl-ACP methyl ester carboxylesterase
MGESTRPLPPLIPLSNGGWEVNSFLSSAEYTIRGMGLMPSNHIVPVIVVPGIMGSNLRAKRFPRLGRKQDERNQVRKPGQAVWTPPNGKIDGFRASRVWSKIPPQLRQMLFDAATLEVDEGGPIQLPLAEDGYVLSEVEVRQRGWGEVHADSYGRLLHTLQTHLNQSFQTDDGTQKRTVQQHWKDVMACDPRNWGVREFDRLTEAELEKHARHYFPVYAVGYNWLEDCQLSSQRLERRINEILSAWRNSKRRCEKVILVTHSMGGLVARACAQRIPEKIAGVIHGAMPSTGAPVAYRRIACGTESYGPRDDLGAKVSGARLALILGETADKTTPVLATSAGALELLPNHLYPGPWLHVTVVKVAGGKQAVGHGMRDAVAPITGTPADFLHLPGGTLKNPYDLYRDKKSWYRMINPQLADPANRLRKEDGGVDNAIELAIERAEKFHRSLGDFYHPNSYVFYGDDADKLSYGQVRWVAHQWCGAAIALTSANVAKGRFLGHSTSGSRRVEIEGEEILQFEPEAQDARGDGTVPRQSGSSPSGKVKQVFAPAGFDHQHCFNNNDVLMLTLRLIVKIVQEMS